MSYIRAGHELRDFEGESELYVFSNGNNIVDYGADYRCNASFAQLCVNMFRHSIDDDDYIEKIKVVLGKKLGVIPKLREK